MSDLQSVPVSVGRGVHFIGHHHQELYALYNSMRSGVFKDDRGNKIDLKRQIEEIRRLTVVKKKEQATKLKNGLICFIASGTVKDGIRKQDHFETHSGRLQLDFDDLGPEVAPQLGGQISKDPHIEFAAISPSGDGLKGSILIPPCKTNVEQHKAFDAVQNYIEQRYNQKLDSSCRDITRLMFMTFDPNAYIANSPKKPLNIEDWLPRTTDGKNSSQKTVDTSAEQILGRAASQIRNALDGERHQTRRNQARLIGGYVASGALDESEALEKLIAAALENTDNPKKAEESIRAGFEHGKLDPIQLENKGFKGGSKQFADDTSSWSSMYTYGPEGTTRWKKTQHGKDPIPLANFTAKIVEEQILDDGDNSESHYRIEAKCGGKPLPEEVVRAEKFPSLEFVARSYGVRAQIFPGLGTKDYLRHAIQVASGENVPRTRVFRHTGFREIEGQLTYLHGGGALDLPGVEVRLDTDAQHQLKRYWLPAQSTLEERDQALKTSLSFIDIAPRRITYPLWAAAYGATIISELEDHFPSLFLLGPSGCRKTTLAISALCHHGAFTPEELFTFNDTANSLEKAAFILRDAPMLVDDFYPTTIKRDQQRMISTFEALARNSGNRSGRGRMNADLSLRKTFYPRGMIWFTGEDLVGASSALARLTLVELESGDVNTDRLSVLQKKHPQLPHAMADWLRWWRDQRDFAKAIFANKELETKFHREHTKLHGRLPKQIAIWTKLIEVLCHWLIDRKILTNEQAEQLHSDAEEIFIQNAFLLQDRIHSSTPVEQFLEVIQSLKSSDKLWLKKWHFENSDAQHGKDFFGWETQEHVYAQGKTVWHILQTYFQRENAHFPVGERSLWKLLRSEGVLIPQNGENFQPHQIPAEEGKSIRVMKLLKNRLFGTV